MRKFGLIVVLLFVSVAALPSTVDSLLSIVSHQSGIDKMNTLIKLYEENKDSDPYKAIDYIKEAIAISEKVSTSGTKCTVYNKLGNVYFHLGLNFLAMDAYYAALKFAEDSHDPKAVPFCLIDVGNVYYSVGNYDRALEYYHNSIEIFQRNKDTRSLAVAYNNIGLVKLNTEEYDSALDFFMRAYKIRQETEGLFELAHSNIYISDTYFSMQQYDKALEHLKIADELYEKSNNQKNRAVVASRMGDVYMADKKYKEAITKYIQGLEVFNKIDNYTWIVIDNLSLAKAYKEIGQFHNATECAQKALKKSQENNYGQYLPDLIEVLADIYYENGQVDKAYRFRQRLNIVHDSLQKVNDNLKFANLQFSVETLKHRMETERLNNEIHKRNTIRNYIILLFFFVLLAFSFIMSRLKMKRKQEQDWHIQQEEIAALELRQKEDENARLTRELELRNRELTSKTIGIVKTSEFIDGVVKDLQGLEVKKENREKVQQIIEKLRHNQKEDSWEEFEIRFTKVHKDFNQKLILKHPDLTPNERRLCAFLRLNMTTKEISSITYQSSKSIDVARSRLRKKMDLSREENLVCYLADF